MGVPTRAMGEIRNPVYAYNQNADFKRTRTPAHALEQPPAVPRGTDPRLTSAGSVPPVAGLTPIVPMATQNPYNVWALYPA